MSSTSGSSHNAHWEPPSIEELQPLLPQYQITELLGQGGMGAVYEGTQSMLNRPVAIKLLPETLRNADTIHRYVDRFRLEATAMGNLQHIGIVPIYEFGETSAGHLFIAMEYVDGMDLQQFVREKGGKLEQAEALTAICHILDALAFAHQNGIIHRDIKPANILINQEGQMKIADFGLAKQFDRPGESMGLTMTNVVMGTVDYLAPEMLEGTGESDGRGDLYAVGVILYLLLTGKLPRGSFRLPSEVDPSLDSRLDPIVSRALEPDPERRFQSAEDFRLAINELLPSPVSHVSGRRVPRGPKPKRKSPIALLSTGLVPWAPKPGSIKKPLSFEFERNFKLRKK